MATTKLPLLLSVPHAGLQVPPEVEPLSLLTPEQIAKDGDEGAAEIYDLAQHVEAYVSTEIARAFVDQNRAVDDRRADGVVKTHTCWEERIYREALSEETVSTLLDRYHRPYHEALAAAATRPGVICGIDGHTMAAIAPPIGPDVGPRPEVCLGNADGTCPASWIESLAECLRDQLPGRITINDPFRGGYITRSQPGGIPWIQIEFSRAPFLPNSEKRSRLLGALRRWCIDLPDR